MKTKEEIEQLAFLKYPRVINDPYNPMEDDNTYERKIWIDAYTQCQEDIADNWIKVEDIEKGFEQFYPNGEKCEFTAHTAAHICEVIFKNKINKQDNEN